VKKYDTSKDGKIDVKEFGNLLAECNGGTRPTDEEIAWVHRVADCRKCSMPPRRRLPPHPPRAPAPAPHQPTPACVLARAFRSQQLQVRLRTNKAAPAL